MSDATVQPEGVQDGDPTVYGDGGKAAPAGPAGEVTSRRTPSEQPAATVGAVEEGDATVGDEDVAIWGAFEEPSRGRSAEEPSTASVGETGAASRPEGPPPPLPGMGQGIAPPAGPAKQTEMQGILPEHQHGAAVPVDPLGDGRIPGPTGETPEEIQAFLEQAGAAQQQHPSPKSHQWPGEISPPASTEIQKAVSVEEADRIDIKPLGLDLSRPHESAADLLARPIERMGLLDAAASLPSGQDLLQHSSQPMEYSMELVDQPYHPLYETSEVMIGKPAQIGKPIGGGGAEKGPHGETPPGQLTFGKRTGITGGEGGGSDGGGRTGTGPIGGVADANDVVVGSTRTRAAEWEPPDDGSSVTSVVQRGTVPVGGDSGLPESGQGGVLTGQARAAPGSMATVTGEAWVKSKNGDETYVEPEEQGDSLADTLDRYLVRREVIELLERIVNDLNEAARPVVFKVDEANLTVEVDYEATAPAYRLFEPLDLLGNEQDPFAPETSLDWRKIKRVRDAQGKNTRWIQEFVEVLEDPNTGIRIRFTDSTAAPAEPHGDNMIGPSPAWIAERVNGKLQINIYWNALAANQVADAVYKKALASPFRGRDAEGKDSTQVYADQVAGLCAFGALFVHEAVKHHALMSWVREQDSSATEPRPSERLILDAVPMAIETAERLGRHRDVVLFTQLLSDIESGARRSPEMDFGIKRAIDLALQGDGYGLRQQQQVMADLGYKMHDFEEPFGKGKTGTATKDWPGYVHFGDSTGGLFKVKFKAYLEEDSSVSEVIVTRGQEEFPPRPK